MNLPTYTPSGYSNEIFKSRYAFTEDETWEEACHRVAQQMAKAEAPDRVAKYKDKFNNILVSNYFVPGGRIWYNSGRPSPQLLNCFVLGDELDSKAGWGNLSREMVITSMTGGGCGIDFSAVRPKGASIAGHRGSCPGPVELMKLINSNGHPIRAGGHRRVALMFSLDLDHPDIEQFLDAKLENGELSLANVSVRSKRTTEFIKAVKADGPWHLSWKGKYKKTIKARSLWDRIVDNAYNSAEPGFLNWELALSESTIFYIEDLSTTNPCGEIALSPYDCCCLGHLVLPRFVNEAGELDWHLLASITRTGVRFLDNVLTVNHYPLPEMRDKSHKLRRIGLGTTGLADMLTLLGLKYGSKEGNAFVNKLFRFISKAAYEASALLAIEKEPFPACKPELHIQSGYMKRMTKKVKELVAEHGIRNCALLTQAPTGTVSILSDNVSSGVEPMFAPAYERRYWDGDERKMETVFHPLFAKFVKQGKDTRNFVPSFNLTPEQHMEVQKIVQSHVDNAVSKTINMPLDYPVEDMNSMWLSYLTSLKGTTFFRTSSRGYIDENGNLEPPPLSPLTIEEAYAKFSTEAKEGAEVDCASGTCEI